MGYEINFAANDLPREEQERNAIDAIRDYNPRVLESVETYTAEVFAKARAKQERISIPPSAYDGISMMFAMGGVSGYPVRVWYGTLLRRIRVLNASLPLAWERN